MKNEIEIPLPKVEDLAALNRRRDNYALKRDQQALEFNDAIAKRLLSEAKNKIKCEKCGKEFSAGDESELSAVCPDCD